MRFLVLSLTIFFFHTAHSQEFEVKKVSTANFKEFYTVNKISKLENGTYLKLDKQNKDTLISGTYLNGVKSGIWRYFSKGNNLCMSYNFDRKAFEKLPEEISRIDSFVVKKADSFTYEKVDLPPVYLGSKNEIGRILAANFKFHWRSAKTENQGFPSQLLQLMKMGSCKICCQCRSYQMKYFRR